MICRLQWNPKTEQRAGVMSDHTAAWVRNERNSGGDCIYTMREKSQPCGGAWSRGRNGCWIGVRANSNFITPCLVWYHHIYRVESIFKLARGITEIRAFNTIYSLFIHSTKNYWVPTMYHTLKAWGKRVVSIDQIQLPAFMELHERDIYKIS